MSWKEGKEKNSSNLDDVGMAAIGKDKSSGTTVRMAKANWRGPS